MACNARSSAAYKGRKKHAWKLCIDCLCEPSDAELHQGNAGCLGTALVGLQLGVKGQVEEALLGGNIAIEQDGAD